MGTGIPPKSQPDLGALYRNLHNHGELTYWRSLPSLTKIVTGVSLHVASIPQILQLNNHGELTAYKMAQPSHSYINE